MDKWSLNVIWGDKSGVKQGVLIINKMILSPCFRASFNECWILLKLIIIWRHALSNILFET